MKIAVTSKGKKLDSAIDPRFGRCDYFVIVDGETMGYETIDNKAAMASGGAGPQAAQIITEKNAGVVITGNVGPNAYHALEAAGITVITGASGTVEEAVKKYKEGKLEQTSSASVSSHSGLR